VLRFLLLADALPPHETTLISAITTAVATLLVVLLRNFAKDKAEQRLKMLINLAHCAYIITAEVARKTPNQVDDKAAFALDVLRKALADRGAAPLTEVEQAKAEFAWRTMHSDENLNRMPPGTAQPPALPQ